MARILVVAPGRTGGPGSMGEKILCAALGDAGHSVTHATLADTDGAVQGSLFHPRDVVVSTAAHLPRPDAVFVSTIYTRQWLHLRRMFERLCIRPLALDRSHRDPLVVFGGQTSFAPDPIADMADIVALGDGEVTGKWIANRIDLGGGRDALLSDAAQQPFLWVPSSAAPRQLARAETPGLAARIIYPGAGHRHPTIEVARGCKSKCAFCPIGWSGGTYREAPSADVMRCVEQCAVRFGRRSVNLFAPDYSSVSYAGDLDRYAASHGCRNSGLDARLDGAERHMAAGGTVRSFSFGIEGPSERLRRLIGKPLASDRIVSVMSRLSGVHCKFYIILGLPTESESDIAELRDTIDRVLSVHSGFLNVTLTLLQPVPHTPMEGLDGHYPTESAERGAGLRAWARDHDGPAHRVMFSQPKGRDLHEHDVAVQRAGRECAKYLLAATEAGVASGAWRLNARRAGVDVEALLEERRGRGHRWIDIDVGTRRARDVAEQRMLERAARKCHVSDQPTHTARND